jgi:hypothetical protein
MATIGTLVVEMRANNAQFHTEMGKSQGAMGKTGGSSRQLTNQLSKLAASGFGAVIPGAEGAERAIGKFTVAASKMGGAMGLLGPALLVIGAGFAAFKIGERISEWVALGTSAENYKKKVEEALEAQKKFSEQMAKDRSTANGLAKELANLQGNWEKVIRLDRVANEEKALGIKDPAKRAEALANAAAIETEQRRVQLEKQAQERRKFEEDAFNDLIKAREARFKVWQEETTEFAKQLQSRVTARQQFEAQFGQGGLPGLSATKGIREALDLQKQMEKELKDLAFAKREGLISETDVQEGLQGIRERAIAAGDDIRQKFGGAFPAVDTALNKTLGNVDNLGSQFEKARGFIDATVPTVGQLTEQLNQFNGMLQATPPATAAAQSAIAALSQQYRDLSSAVYESVQAVQAWQQASTQ